MEDYPDKIYLLGFMGVGKSTVSVELAKQLGYKNIELDDEVEKDQGMSITEIFRVKGEDYFRELETQILKLTSEQNKAVISCGGGIVLRDENIEFIKESGGAVLLTATPQTVYNRISHTEHRPVLKDKMTLQEIEKVMARREEKYKRAATITVKTDEREIQDIVKEITAKLK